MTNENDYTKLIEDYLRDDLPAAEKVSFEKRMETDPLLKNEFELQKDIINVIRDSRRIQLKTRLTNTHIGWYHLVPASWKVAATVTIAVVAGIAAFYFLRPAQVNKPTPVENISTINPDLKQEEPSQGNLIKPQQENSQKKASDTNKVLPVDKKKDQPAHVKSEEQQPHESKAISVPQPGQEEKAGDLPDNSLKDDDNSKIEPAVIENSTSKALSLKTVASKEYAFHYSFTGGALTLYGNFDGNPYKILEVNSKKGKEYYLIYHDNFYSLYQNSSGITPLVRVTDKNLLNELEILKNNK
jgi:negative regulator of sigma E activity